MAAVQAILSTLNGLTQSVPARGRRRASGSGAAAGLAEGPYAHAGAEPALEELLGDPVIRLLMRADRVEPAEIRRLLGAPPLAV